MACIVFRTAVKLIGSVDQYCKLRTDRATLEQRYKELPKEITDMIPLDRIDEGRPHQIRLNNFDMFGLFSDMIIDFAIILLDVPALIWYGWL